MREKYESLPLTTLRDIARDRGIRHLSGMKKADVVEALLATDPKPEQTKPEQTKSEQTKSEQGRPEQQTPKQPRTEQPRTEQPRTEQPRSEQGRSEQQFVRQPRAEQPRSEQPRSEQQPARQPRTDKSEGTSGAGVQRGVVRQPRTEYGQGNQRNVSRSYRPDGERTFQNGSSTRRYMPRQNRPESGPTQSSSPVESQPVANTVQPPRIDYRTEVHSDPVADAREQAEEEKKISLESLDSGETADGILEVMPEGFGFIRSANYLPGDNDVYVAPSQIRRFNMKTGDIVKGTKRIKTATEKFAALLFVSEINGFPTRAAEKRPNFEDLTPIFPNSRLHLEIPGGQVSMRIMDLLSPIGKGQRGMIVSPPKAGKTTLLKQVAQSIRINHPSMHLIVLLIDERPEEVTDIKESIEGPSAEVIYSTFDELPEHHKRVSEMVLERAKRLVEHGMDVTILLDSITRLARAYNLTVAPSGRTLSGGLDPAALHMPKRFFGAARNMREGGSLTILATALVETGSRMDDVVFEEFKGTGNMELVLNRKLSEKRIFPAVDIMKSSTRRDDLLLTQDEQEAVENIRRATSGMKGEEAAERILDMFARTRNNQDFVAMAKKTRFI